MPSSHDSQRRLKEAIAKEGQVFEHAYLWLEKQMPTCFFKEIEYEHILLITSSLVKLDLQEFFSTLHIKNKGYSLSLEGSTTDIDILNLYGSNGIKHYKTYVSQSCPDFIGATQPLMICALHLIQGDGHVIQSQQLESTAQDWLKKIEGKTREISSEILRKLLPKISSEFLSKLDESQVPVALDLLYRALSRDECQYDLQSNEHTSKENTLFSHQVICAWRSPNKPDLLYQIRVTAALHDLNINEINLTYVKEEKQGTILLICLHFSDCANSKRLKASNVQDFLEELVTLRYFTGMDLIQSTFVVTKKLSGNLGNLTKSIAYFLHQVLVHMDSSIYTLSQIEEDLCRHPEITIQILELFEKKFDPKHADTLKYQSIYKTAKDLIDNLDTGNSQNDTRRKTIFKQAIHFVDHTLKTNFYRKNKTAHCFRLDPQYLEHVPYNRMEKFPEIPHAIFFMKGRRFLGFHIRFKDLSRGGLRTVVPEKIEQMLSERNNVFAECYGLALTQQKKNKDIPEGGAKGVIFLEPSIEIEKEKKMVQYELIEAELPIETISKYMESFAYEQKMESMYHAQRAYIESFMTLINCDVDGKIRAKDVVDYYKKPEYIYLGPDENMHNHMIEWIAEYSKQRQYKPGGAFISSKPSAGINHKEYGVTSLGVNVYVEEVLRYLKIDPTKDTFTIKMTGGPDGDVAGNEMANLYHLYPRTAKLIATIDVSGTIYDPQGLDLKTVYELFTNLEPIAAYPPSKLSEGGFVLDRKKKQEDLNGDYKTLCTKKHQGKLVEDWLVTSEMNHLLGHNVHQAKADIFVPGGGRPRTLNGSNVSDFLDPSGKPTARAIVEGANLYLTPEARRSLEKLGVLIVKDSSANKGGVTCSSFEVLSTLCLSEKEFLEEKSVLVPQILEIIKAQARDEARLLLNTHKDTNAFLTDISDAISHKINSFMYELLNFLEPMTLSDNPKDPLIQALLNYCPPLLRTKYPNRVIKEIPNIHKKAIIACHLASRVVYQRGLEWSPHVTDVLPLLCQDQNITGPTIN